MTPLRGKAREGEESPDARVLEGIDRGIEVFLDKFKETREEAPRPVQEPSSCLKIVKCVGRRVFIKSIRLHEELFPPRSVTNAARPSP